MMHWDIELTDDANCEVSVATETAERKVFVTAVPVNPQIAVGIALSNMTS
jgi:hypothetical protein